MATFRPACLPGAQADGGLCRYVGTLHEINSENSTVALENVKSFGTEGRRGNPDDEIPPNDQIYDYIVFRGSDVKDLTIVEPPKENKPPQAPQMPNDPAILGVSCCPSQKMLETALMKHSGCKFCHFPRAQNQVDTFRCLPSEPTHHSLA